ncbi:MAG: threonine synthase [Deltaproteobacteria bacterium]|nr:threonine synthase [Deltaproteobacteria bacterium]
MNTANFPEKIREYLIPKPEGKLVFRCLNCQSVYNTDELFYTCPKCGEVLLIYDENFDRLKNTPSALWHDVFDYRKMLNIKALKGIYRYYEFLGSMIPLDSIIYLGEGHTPVIEANSYMQNIAQIRFFFKNDGQNPSASFKDRGMASAFSYINFLIKKGKFKNILAICASTGDTSAAAALYASYIGDAVKSAVLLPYKKVTPQQLLQPLGSGAKVFEIPGLFDDCMKVVENLSKNYNVALLNSKNAWRILGQESYSYEIAQEFNYNLKNKVVVIPIGNAGNITAVMNGFIKFYEAGIIDNLPKIIGVQSEHADPVYRYYAESDPVKRRFIPLKARASVAQAAMIGNPVSMPRVIHLEALYNKLAGKQKVFFVQTSEQDIIDWQLMANRNGHIACTHGGETLAGLVKAKKEKIVNETETAIIDSTAHALKFSVFTDTYFQNNFSKEFEITPKSELCNAPILIEPSTAAENRFEEFVKDISDKIAANLKLKKKQFYT